MTYYIDNTGVDTSSRNGLTTATAWRTLSYACAHVNTLGSIIHINTGTYTETSQSVLAVGVSIEGDGLTSIIHSHVSGNDPSLNGELKPTIRLESAADGGTNGNQSISNFKMDGSSLESNAAILVWARSNVSIHDMYIVDFFDYGVKFNTTWYETEPTHYSVNNSFYNNIVTNCATYMVGYSGKGNLMIGGQENMSIYGNTINQPARSGGPEHYGWPIAFTADGYFKGLKIYNNSLLRIPDNGTWDFAIEMWNNRGGLEIYNNILEGSVDLGGISTIDDYGYGFAAKIHDNIIGYPILHTGEEVGITIELTQTGGCYIYNNIFKNLYTPIVFYPNGANPDIIEDIYIYYNQFYNIGKSGASGGMAIQTYGFGVHSNAYSNINILNNVFYAGAGITNGNALQLQLFGSANNINIKNNIITGFALWPVVIEADLTFDNVHIDNNIFYNNGNNVILRNTIPTNYTANNNLTSNPLFVSTSDFHLQNGSPAINSGINVGLTTDFEGYPVDSIPERGVYEYAGAYIPVTAVTVTGAGDATTISVDNGTLQMSAHIDPHDATDQAVVWSVINGTGTASINQAGLLTAITNGTVTVKAVSNG